MRSNNINKGIKFLDKVLNPNDLEIEKINLTF